jgi:hypothetical protein
MGTPNPNLLRSSQCASTIRSMIAAMREIRDASVDAQFEDEDLDRLRNQTEELDINGQYSCLSSDTPPNHLK